MCIQSQELLNSDLLLEKTSCYKFSKFLTGTALFNFSLMGPKHHLPDYMKDEVLAPMLAGKSLQGHPTCIKFPLQTMCELCKQLKNHVLGCPW